MRDLLFSLLGAFLSAIAASEYEINIRVMPRWERRGWILVGSLVAVALGHLPHLLHV